MAGGNANDAIAIDSSSEGDVISLSSSSPPPRKSEVIDMYADDDDDDDEDEIMQLYIPMPNQMKNAPSAFQRAVAADAAEAKKQRFRKQVARKSTVPPRPRSPPSSRMAAFFPPPSKKRSRLNEDDSPVARTSERKSPRDGKKTTASPPKEIHSARSPIRPLQVFSRAVGVQQMASGHPQGLPRKSEPETVVLSSSTEDGGDASAESVNDSDDDDEQFIPVDATSSTNLHRSRCPICWQDIPSEDADDHKCHGTTETRHLRRLRAMEHSSSPTKKGSEAASGRARMPKVTKQNYSSSSDSDKEDAKPSSKKSKGEGARPVRHTRRYNNHYVQHFSPLKDDDDDSSSEDMKMPATLPGRSNRAALKKNKTNSPKPSADDSIFSRALREEVEEALRQVRTEIAARKKQLLKQELTAKNELLTNAKKKTQPLPNYRRLLWGEDVTVESSYMRHEDHPVPKDSHHTIFIRKHFSSLAAEKDDDDEEGDKAPPSPCNSSGPDDSDNESSSSDDKKCMSPSKKKYARQIEEFQLEDRIGVGYEEDELDADITKVLERFKETRHDRQKIHEYLSILLQVKTKRVNALWEKVSGAGGEPRRQHKTKYEEVMSSFRDLFCRRCLTFDCNLHGLQEDYPPGIQLELATRLENSGFWKNDPDEGHEMCLPVGSSISAALDADDDASHYSEPSVDRDLDEDEMELSKRLYQLFQNDLGKVAFSIGVSQDCIRRQVQLENFEVKLMDPHLKSKHNKSNSYHPEWIKRIVQATSHPFFNPCTHSEPCSEETCSCIQDRFFCTKACIWGASSRNFFRGCNCSSKCTNKSCPCFASNRECDPDLCKRCGACSDPPNQPATTQKCRNDNVGMRRHVHLLLGKSRVKDAGWGLFTKHALKKGDYVHEYLGELITHNEAERRGKIYDDRNQTYIFDMSTDYAVDALKVGNKTRFINHKDNPNIEPQMKVVNGDYRIGFFASRDIKEQEELFFNYGDKFFKATGGFNPPNASKQREE